MNVVIKKSEKQFENSLENGNEVKESSSQKKVEIKEYPSTPPKRRLLNRWRRKHLMLLLLPTSQ